MVIVTAADTSYFGGLINLIGSIHYWMPDTKVVIYDLGLEDRCKREIPRWRNVYFIESFLQNLPEHCSELKSYAWKPLAIYSAIQEHDTVLWIDAGSDIRASLDAVRSYLLEDGYFFVQGQDVDMTRMSHPGSYQCLGVDMNNFIGRQHYAGNLQGYCYGSKAFEEVLVPLKNAALDKQCIAPPGSNLANHRYDQTLLSILLYQSGLYVIAHTEFLAAQRTQLHKDPRQPSQRLVYTARNSAREYTAMVQDLSGGDCYPIHNQAGARIDVE